MTINNNKNIIEAEATVRKDVCGKYIDLAEHSLVNQGYKHLSNEQVNKLLSHLRLRFTLTTKCNLWCVFCSNEGSDYTSKSQGYADIDSVIKLSELLLKNTPIKSVDFSGGEPLMHPDFTTGKLKLIKWTRRHPNIRFSVHSNGINLSPKIIDAIKDGFSRIGISVHSVNFDTWNKMTNLNNMFDEKVQKNKFEKMINNIDYIGKQNIGHKVFIKIVLMKGINDSKEDLLSMLNFCDKYDFHPKFLEFEPQYPDQNKFIVGRKELFAKLEKIGCEFSDDTPRHNDPNTYIPGVNFTYKNNNTLIGLHSIFGCGLKAACESCYDFLCIFVKPYKNRKGLYLMPCSVLDTRIDLSYAIDRGDANHLLDLFRLSREYLMLTPGIGFSGWNKKKTMNLNNKD